MNEILEAALEYASRGWAVFPISKEKTPLTTNGCNDASTDPEVIKKWWHAKPAANVAIATGSKSGGLVVIDIDVDYEKNKNGQETLDEWMDETGCYIDSRTVVTGRGGKHLYFTTSESFGCKVGAMKDIDIRGEGGYVVAPPSIHKNGNEYYWDEGVSGEDPIVCVQEDSDVEYFLHECFKNLQSEEKIKFEIPSETVEGSRNDIIFRMASSLQAQGADDDVIFASCQGYNESKCVPPLSDFELKRTVQSALKYEKGKSVIVTNESGAVIKRTYKGKGNRKIEEEVTEYDLDMPTLEEFEKKTKEWLISGYIPKGCVTLLCSDGGIGKTSIWCDTLAALTTGRTTIFDKAVNIPFHTGEERNVMYFSKEDPTEEILKWKFESAEGDQKRVRCFGLDDPRIAKIWYGSLLLEKLIEKFKPDICVFDTLQAFLPDGVDMVKRKDMRDALNPLNQLGAKYGTTFLMIMHANKSSNSGRQRMADSSDIWDIGRSALMCGRTKNKEICYMSHEKCNYGRLQKTILFSVSDNGIEYKGTSNRKDADFVAEGIAGTSQNSPQLDEARDFILEYLSGKENRTEEINKLIACGKSAGISQHALDNARATLMKDKLIERKTEGYGDSKKWYILLPIRKNSE